MSVGSAVRRMLGPLEGRAIRMYRDWFVDLDELARDVVALGPFSRILEIGAGTTMATIHRIPQLPRTFRDDGSKSADAIELVVIGESSADFKSRTPSISSKRWPIFKTAFGRGK